ncbi:MAG: hypothetical protein IJO79_00250 [Firmicutes bacterium]|nr:hypothetical protein [Bacillota bacterium]
MKRKVILLLALCFVLAFAFTACGSSDQEAATTKCTLYCGLNDADAGTQILTIEEAQEMIRPMILEAGTGYTEFVTYGAYEENGTVYGNDTLVYEFYYADRAVVEQLGKDIKEALNLNSVLMTENPSEYGFLE